MLAACFGIRAPPAEVGDIFLPRYIRSKTQSITAKKVGIPHLLDYMASSCQLPSVVIFNS